MLLTRVMADLWSPTSLNDVFLVKLTMKMKLASQIDQAVEPESRTAALSQWNRRFQLHTNGRMELMRHGLPFTG